jgi:hypothetical protein
MSRNAVHCCNRRLFTPAQLNIHLRSENFVRIVPRGVGHIVKDGDRGVLSRYALKRAISGLDRFTQRPQTGIATVTIAIHVSQVVCDTNVTSLLRLQSQKWSVALAATGNVALAVDSFGSVVDDRRLPA